MYSHLPLDRHQRWAVLKHFIEHFAQSELALSYKDYAARTGRFLPNPVKWLRAGWQTQETA